MIKAPFSYFGGKSKIAPIIWKAFGNVTNYVEPFAGSLAVLLANPHIPKIETVNDIDCQLTNWWRAVSKDPNKVAEFAIYPVNEVELHARHRYLDSISNDLKSKMELDVDYFDAKAAGFYCYGMSASIGNNWLQDKGLNAAPLLSSAGGGIHGLTSDTLNHFIKIQNRTKRVRVLCGDYKRILTPSCTYKNVGLSDKDITGVFLDPPYDFSSRDKVYKNDSKSIFKEVVEWCIQNGDHPRMKIALCGYEGDHGLPDTWKKVSWEANGGMANLNNQGKTNAKLERIWFSSACEI